MNASGPLHGARRLVGALILLAALVPQPLSAQSGGARSLFSSGPSLGAPAASTGAPGASIVSPGAGVAAPGAIQAVPPVSAPTAPAGPSGLPGQVTLTLAARFGRDMPINGAVNWRIFADRPDAANVFR